MGVFSLNILQASYALQFPPASLPPPPPTPARSIPSTPTSPPPRRLAAFASSVRITVFATSVVGEYSAVWIVVPYLCCILVLIMGYSNQVRNLKRHSRQVCTRPLLSRHHHGRFTTQYRDQHLWITPLRHQRPRFPALRCITHLWPHIEGGTRQVLAVRPHHITVTVSSGTNVMSAGAFDGELLTRLTQSTAEDDE